MYVTNQQSNMGQPQAINSLAGYGQTAIQPAKEANISAMAQQLLERAASLHNACDDLENHSRRLLMDRVNKASEPGTARPEPSPQTIQEMLRMASRGLADAEGRLCSLANHWAENV